MNLSQPAVSLIPSLAGPVLTVLAGTSGPLTGREVHRLLGKSASQPAVQAVLTELAVHGLVMQARAGNAILNELNRDHVLAPIIEQLPGLRSVALAAIAETTLREAPSATKALLFGSVVRGDSDHTSDIDLALVWPDDTEEDVQASAGANIATEVRRRTGNVCMPLHFTETEYKGLADRAPGLHAELSRDAIDLAAQHRKEYETKSH